MTLKTLTTNFTPYSLYFNTDLDVTLNLSRTINKLKNGHIDESSCIPAEQLNLIGETDELICGFFPLTFTTFRDIDAIYRDDFKTNIFLNGKKYNTTEGTYQNTGKKLFLNHHKVLNDLNADNFTTPMLYVLNYTNSPIYIRDFTNIVKEIKPIPKTCAGSLQYADKIIIIQLYSLINPFKKIADLNSDNYISRLASKYANFTNEAEKELYDIANLILTHIREILNKRTEMMNIINRGVNLNLNENAIDKNMEIIKVATVGMLNANTIFSNGTDSVFLLNKNLLISKLDDTSIPEHPFSKPELFGLNSDDFNNLLNSSISIMIVDNHDKINKNKYAYVINKAVKIMKVKRLTLLDGLYINYGTDGYKKICDLEELDKCNFIYDSQEEAIKPRDIDILKKEYEERIIKLKGEHEEKSYKIKEKELTNKALLDEITRIQKEEQAKRELEREEIKNILEKNRMYRNDYIDQRKFEREYMTENLKFIALGLTGIYAGYQLVSKFLEGKH